MALKKCPECGKEISSQANICPNCGCNTKSKAKKATEVVIALIVAAVIVVCVLIIAYLKMNRMIG